MPNYRTLWGEDTPKPSYTMVLMHLVRLATNPSSDAVMTRSAVHDVRSFALSSRHVLSVLDHAAGSRHWDSSLWSPSVPADPATIAEKIRLVWEIAQASPLRMGLDDYKAPRQHRMFIHEEACFAVVQDLLALHLKKLVGETEYMDGPDAIGTPTPSK